MRLVTWRASSLQSGSVAKPSFSHTGAFLAKEVKKLFPRVKNNCPIDYNAHPRFRSDSQSHLVMGCFCHYGLIKMLF